MRLRDSLLALTFLALSAGSAAACSQHSTKTAAVLTPPASHAAIVAWKPRAWSPAALPAAAAKGLRVAIDPVDGAMGMPAADELGANSVIENDAPVEVVRRDNGSVRATLDERFAEFAVVTLGADGKPAWTCVHGTQGAAKFMQKPVVNRAPAAGTVWEDK